MTEKAQKKARELRIFSVSCNEFLEETVFVLLFFFSLCCLCDLGFYEWQVRGGLLAASS